MTSGAIQPLPIHQRWLLVVLAFLGTALFALSFLPFDGASRPVSAPLDLRGLAPAIGLAAAVSWPIFGVVLLAESRGKPARLALWFDTCLLAMGVGEAFLLLAAAYNAYYIIFTYRTTPAQGPPIAMLVVADIMMARLFIARARSIGLRVSTAIALWVLVLNGVFAITLWCFARLLGYD